MKTSRAASLTPEDMEILSQYTATTTAGSIHPYLSSLVNYIHPVSFSGFDEAESKFKLWLSHRAGKKAKSDCPEEGHFALGLALTLSGLLG